MYRGAHQAARVDVPDLRSVSGAVAGEYGTRRASHRADDVRPLSAVQMLSMRRFAPLCHMNGAEDEGRGRGEEGKRRAYSRAGAWKRNCMLWLTPR